MARRARCKRKGLRRRADTIRDPTASARKDLVDRCGRAAKIYYGGSPGVGPGNAAGSRDALRQIHTLTTLCGSTCCDALVTWLAIKTAAKTANRIRLYARDGCGGPRCAARYSPTRFRTGQHKLAQELADGKRRLVARPLDAHDVSIWLMPREITKKAIQRALQR